jgi:methylmalonyl-CoA mutase N-terminal domain/subunit
MGGMIPAIERGFPQTEIANASYEYQHEIETGEQKIVGVNAFVDNSGEQIELLHIDETSQQHQLEKLAKLKARATTERCERRWTICAAAEGTENTMPFILAAVRASTPRWARFATPSAACSERYQVL